MTESPIRRKAMHYPKDFLPPASTKASSNKKFTFNSSYQIDATSIRKYKRNIQQPSVLSQTMNKSIVHADNPQKSRVAEQQSQDSPLEQHAKGRRPELDKDLLKKPRFSLNDKQQIQQPEDSMQNYMSPGFIRKQLQNRQAPLPAQDPCKIELLRDKALNNSYANSYVKFRSTGDFHSKKWLSSQKDIIHTFRQNQSKGKELPNLARKNQVNEVSFPAAKQQYDTFRKRQDSLGGNFGKVNSLLSAMKKKDNQVDESELPNFDRSSVDRLKDEINSVVRNKKGISKKEEQSETEGEQSPVTNSANKKGSKRKKTHFTTKIEDSRPELLISYRSSLSYLKDLYSKSINLNAYHLVVKIPKLFIENLIFKGQDKEDLYDTAITIFSELRIPHQNLVIKKYTNCTMLIARNVCMIWHFDGKRYLGGWQTEYLDEGAKHGLGLEWEPKRYVYYGEYVRNKKHGLGVYKDRNSLNYIGYWNKGQRVTQEEDYNALEGDQGSPYLGDGTESEDEYLQEDNYQYL